MTVIRRKAFAYITQGHRLLVFTHPDAPEAGTQVPAGTIEHGETPEDAALREAREETGLSLLTVVRFLGTSRYDRSLFGRDEVAQLGGLAGGVCVGSRVQFHDPRARTVGGRHLA